MSNWFVILLLGVVVCVVGFTSADNATNNFLEWTEKANKENGACSREALSEWMTEDGTWRFYFSAEPGAEPQTSIGTDSLLQTCNGWWGMVPNAQFHVLHSNHHGNNGYTAFTWGGKCATNGASVRSTGFCHGVSIGNRYSTLDCYANFGNQFRICGLPGNGPSASPPKDTHVHEEL